MGPSYRIFLVASTLLNFFNCGAAFCETGWSAYNDELCIKAFPNWLPYNEAKEFCSSQSNGSYTASLVMVKNVDMQNLLATYTHNIFASVWLGGKYDDKTAQFLWDDGDSLKYTNWREGYNMDDADSDSCIEFSPSNVIPSLNSKGKWAEVFCQKRNLVMCQRTSTWTLQDAVTEIKRMREQFTYFIKKLEAKQKHFEEELEAVKARVVPIGSIYVEYSNQPSPRLLWPSLTWEDISDTYAGLFFRVSGGDSEGWGVTQAECAPRITNMNYTHSKDNFPSMVTIASSGWSEFGRAGFVYVKSNSSVWVEGIQFNTHSCEVRPQNQAVRIWRRTG